MKFLNIIFGYLHTKINVISNSFKFAKEEFDWNWLPEPSAPLPEPRTPSTPLPEPRTPVTSTPRADVRFRPFRPSTSTGGDNSLVPVLLKEVQEQRQTIDMMNRKLDAPNRRTASLELQLKTVLANTNVLIDVMRKLANENSAICQMPSGSDDDPTDSTPQGIPEEFQLEDSYLRKTLRESRNSGNFAVNLTRRLFPELFGEGQLRFEYNWYGGGKHTKKELDPVRKQIIRRYGCFFFPEFKSEEAWRERIVIKINECLRRNDKRVKKDCVSTSIIIQETDPLCPSDVFTFTD